MLNGKLSVLSMCNVPGQPPDNLHPDDLPWTTPWKTHPNHFLERFPTWKSPSRIISIDGNYPSDNFFPHEKKLELHKGENPHGGCLGHYCPREVLSENRVCTATLTCNVHLHLTNLYRQSLNRVPESTGWQQ